MSTEPWILLAEFLTVSMFYATVHDIWLIRSQESSGKSLPILTGNHQIVEIIVFFIRNTRKANSYITALKNVAEIY